MGAEAPGFTPRIEESGFLKAGFRAARNVSSVRGGCNLAPGNFLVGYSGHRETTIRLNDVFSRRLHQMPGDPPRLFDDAIDSGCQGAATNDGAAAAEGADALLDHQSVAVSNRHVI